MKKLIILLTFLLLPPLCRAIISELPATPDIFSEPNSKLLITEVNFKNKEKDYFVLTYTSPTGKPTNLKSLVIKDDGVIKKIENDFFVASGQQILFTYKTDQPDSSPYLNSTKTGLTATTEQLILYNSDSSIIDMVCWVSETPTTSELSEFLNAYENEGWASNDINSCISSDAIATNESIKRLSSTDTNSASDWVLPITATTQSSTPQTQIIVPSTETPNIELTDLTLPQTQSAESTFVQQTTTKPIPDIKLVTIETPVTKTSETSSSTSKKSSTNTQNFSNGTLSTDIVISEILPNPDGTDTGKEWVELTNNGDSIVNLGNWLLDDDEGGSKPCVLPDNLVIKGGETILINGKTCKLSLGNGEDSVRLFNYLEESVSEVQYENAPSGESYSLIGVTDENDEINSEYIWTTNPTPGLPNPEYNKFRVTINQEPTFETKYFFMAETLDLQQMRIIFDEKIIAAPLAKATFKKDTTLNIIVEENNGDFALLEYEVIGSTTINNQPTPFLIPLFIGFLIISVIILYILYKKINWKTLSKSEQKPKPDELLQ